MDFFLSRQKSSVGLINYSTNHLISQLEYPVSASKINSTKKPRDHEPAIPKLV